MSRRRALALSLPLAAGTGRAQEFRATVVGKVTDPKQAAIAGASVEVTNTATGQVFRTVTNDEGNYITPFLNPGKYRVTAELPGFKRAIADGIVLRLNDRVTIDLTQNQINFPRHVQVALKLRF